MSGVRPSTHKLQPIGGDMQVVYPATDLMRYFNSTTDSIFVTNETSSCNVRNKIFKRSILVEINDAHIVHRSMLGTAAVEVVADLAGLDGTLFDLPPAQEVKKLLLARGYSEDAADMEIAEAYRDHLRFVGISLSEHTPGPNDDAANKALSAQYVGIINFWSLYRIEAGDALQICIPTRQQLEAFDHNELATYHMWEPGQVPVLLRPVNKRTIREAVSRAIALYLKHPDINEKLYGTNYLNNVARNNGLIAMQVGQLTMAGLAIASWMKASGTTFVPVTPRPGTDKRSITSARPKADATLDYPNNAFKIDTSGNCRYPQLRQMLYRNKVQNRLAREGDPDGQIEELTDHDDFLTVFFGAMGLIPSGEVIPRSWEGLVGEEFARNRAVYANNQKTGSDIVNMKKSDPLASLLSACTQWQLELLKTLNLPELGVEIRSSVEIGDVESETGDHVVNIAKTSGSNGLINDTNLEIGRCLQVQELNLAGYVTAMAQLMQYAAHNSCARSVRKNGPHQLAAAFITAAAND